jgi:hypothetical protein
VRFVIGEEAAGLLIRNCVAVPTNGEGAEAEVAMSKQTFHAILGGKLAWSAAEIKSSGDQSVIDAVRRCFDHPGITS